MLSTPIQPVTKPQAISVRATCLFLLAVCGALCLFHWGKLDSLWGDSPRWIFEAYRTAAGEIPYRDFTWQYPPLSLFLSAAALLVGGAKFASLQAFLDILAVLLVLLTWDTARRFLPGILPALVAVVLACAGVANGGNFALFSLQIYTPAILLGAIGLLLVIRELADYLASGSMAKASLAWLIAGSTIGLLTKPESAVGVLGCLGATALLDRRRFAGNQAAWFRRHAILIAQATLPSIVLYLALFAVCGFRNVLSGIGGYGTAALACPWWPTGLGIFGALVAVGYGVIAAAIYSLFHVRRLWVVYGRAKVLWLWAAALVSVAATIVYLPFCVAELPVFSGKATPFHIASYFLSTGTVLLPVMWIGIILWLASIARVGRTSKRDWTKHSLFILLVAPAFLISLRGLFGGTMSQLTQVSMAAYPIWFIVWPYLMLSVLRKWESAGRALAAVAAVLIFYAALRLAGAAVVEAKSPYTPIHTSAGTIRLRDATTGPDVYSYVMAHTVPGEPVLDIAEGGGINFAEHRSSPIFSTQFTSFTPTAKHMNADLARIEKSPPRLVIANQGSDFQATFGLCLNTGCPFPAVVWRSHCLACDSSRTFPVLDYIRDHYHLAQQFGEKAIYLLN